MAMQSRCYIPCLAFRVHNIGSVGPWSYADGNILKPKAMKKCNHTCGSFMVGLFPKTRPQRRGEPRVGRIEGGSRGTHDLRVP